MTNTTPDNDKLPPLPTRPYTDPDGNTQHVTPMTFTADEMRSYARAALLAEASAAPIDMVLHCPVCRLQHIDAPEETDPATWTPERYGDWTNPPHRSHLCHGCGHIWRPADLATNGVQEIQTLGKDDSAAPKVAEPTTRNKMEHAAQHLRVAIDCLVKGAKARPDLMCGWWDDACTHAEIAEKDVAEALSAQPSAPKVAEPGDKRPSTITLYSGNTDEPYITIDGSDLWCNASDFPQDRRWKIRWMVEQAQAALAAQPSAGVQERHLPPLGWRCTRGEGHEGPCAAIEDDRTLSEQSLPFSKAYATGYADGLKDASVSAVGSHQEAYRNGYEQGWHDRACGSAHAFLSNTSVSVQEPVALPPIERDEQMQRDYIPMPGGWEVQTQGKGSTFRICETKTGKRWIITDKMAHAALEQMARDSRTAAPAAKGAEPIPLATINEWAERRAKAIGPAGITSPVALMEEGVRWAEAQHGIGNQGFAAKGAEQWQPIETAPKDGSSILVIDSTALAPMAGTAHYFQGQWRAGNRFDWDEMPDAESFLGFYMSPTNWQPLPLPPIGNQGGSGK